jgi:hypothetical protein
MWHLFVEAVALSLVEIAYFIEVSEEQIFLFAVKNN